MSTSRRRRNAAGFTLVELLVVCVILAAIALLASSMVSGVQTDSEIAVNMNNCARIRGALQTFYTAHNSIYPDNWYSLLDRTTFAGAVDFYKGRDTNGDGTVGGNFDTNRGIYGHLRAWNGLGSSSRYLIPARPTSSMATGLRKAGIETLWDYDGTLNVPKPTQDAVSPTSRAMLTGEWVAMVDPRTTYGQRMYGWLGLPLPTNPSAFGAAISSPIDLVALTAAPSSADALSQSAGTTFVLLAFGLGHNSRLLGDARGGLDSTPQGVTGSERDDTSAGNFVVIFRAPLGSLGSLQGDDQAELVTVLNPEGRSIGNQSEEFQENRRKPGQ